MGRGVKKGTIRGDYRRHGKPRLVKLAKDIRANKLDAEAVAHAFEARGEFWDLLIAKQLRAGEQFNSERLADAVMRLQEPSVVKRNSKRIPMWMAKAALRRLSLEQGGKEMSIHAAIGVSYPYSEDRRVRAYHRQMTRDYGPRGGGHIEERLAKKWPYHTPGKFPKLDQAIRLSLLGYGVPLEVWRAVRRKR